MNLKIKHIILFYEEIKFNLNLLIIFFFIKIINLLNEKL